MDLFSMILGLPLAPLRGVLAVGRVLQQEAEQQLYDPTRVRREIEEIESAADAGELSKGEAQREEEQILGRVVNQ